MPGRARPKATALPESGTPPEGGTPPQSRTLPESRALPVRGERSRTAPPSSRARAPRPPEPPVNLEAVTFHEVDRERWPDLVRLFEGRGGPKHCWCMVWREVGPNRGQLTRDDRKNLLAQQVTAGVPIGLLAYLDDEPVAWCSVAPRDRLRERALGGPEAEPGEVVWSIVCFFAQRRLRGAGLARALLSEAVRLAASHGATTIEAYPVDRDSPSYRYMGFTSMFRAAGFRGLGRAGTRRHVMRLQIEG